MTAGPVLTDGALDQAEADALAAGLRHRLRAHAARHANADGLADSPVPGLRMMCALRPAGPIRSLYRPLVCVVLQGRKQLALGAHSVQIEAGQMVLVGVDTPVSGSVLQASPEAPYLAVAVELDLGALHALDPTGAGLATPAEDATPLGAASRVQVAPTSLELLACVARLMRLVSEPGSIATLQPLLSQQLHHALLHHGAFGPALWQLAPAGPARKVADAVKALREDFRSPLTVQRLADLACMSPPTFYRRFKDLTSLTPIQFQKQLRLIEARRLMRFDGYTATRAALDVGYQSVPQFTREYARMFGDSPARQSRGAEPAP